MCNSPPYFSAQILCQIFPNAAKQTQNYNYYVFAIITATYRAKSQTNVPIYLQNQEFLPTFAANFKLLRYEKVSLSVGFYAVGAWRVRR